MMFLFLVVFEMIFIISIISFTFQHVSFVDDLHVFHDVPSCVINFMFICFIIFMFFNSCQCVLRFSFFFVIFMIFHLSRLADQISIISINLTIFMIFIMVHQVSQFVPPVSSPSMIFHEFPSVLHPSFFIMIINFHYLHHVLSWFIS